MSTITKPRSPVPVVKRPSVALSTGAGQVIDGGRSLLRLGAFTGTKMTVAASGAMWLVCGPTGAGKSSAFQNNPEALVMNMDPSPTPYTPRAMIVPGVRADKKPVIPNPAHPDDPERGTPIELTWDFFLKLKADLIEMALEGDPNRPKLVAMDTVDAATDLIKPWYLAKWNADHPDAPKESFGDIHGKLSGPALNREIVNFGKDLSSAGYGFAWICRAGNKTIYLNDDNREYREGMWLIKESLWNEIIGIAEIIGFVEQSEQLVQVDHTVLDPKTKKPLRTIKRTDRKRVVSMTVTPNDKWGQAKCRYAGVESPIVLSEKNPWDSVNAAIAKAIALNQ